MRFSRFRGNWQYVAGVGNDPRGDARVFNPVKQAVDYDTNGEYVRTWVPELRDVGRMGKSAGGAQASGEDRDSLESLMGVFQAWRMPAEEKKRLVAYHEVNSHSCLSLNSHSSISTLHLSLSGLLRFNVLLSRKLFLKSSIDETFQD